jgi:hypothetical protein
MSRARRTSTTHVGYKGGGQAMPDLLGGQLPLMTDAPSIMASLRRKLRALSPERARRCPGRRLRRVGLRGAAKDWFGAFRRRSIKRTVAGLNAAVREAIRSRDSEALTKVARGRRRTPAKCASLIAEVAHGAAIVKASGFLGGRPHPAAVRLELPSRRSASARHPLASSA